MAKYIISINFSQSDGCLLHNFLKEIEPNIESGYPSNNGRMDKFTFDEYSVTIEMERDVKIDSVNVLSESNGSVFHQIKKALLVFYLASSGWPKVKNIVFTSFDSKGKAKNKTIKELRQPIQNTNEDNEAFSPDNMEFVKYVMLENEEGEAFMNSIVNYLKSFTDSSIYTSFEKAWRALDILGLYNADTAKESESLSQLKEIIYEHPEFFKHLMNILVNQTTDEKAASFMIGGFMKISTFKWFDLFIPLVNDEKINDLTRRLTEFKDFRINNLFHWMINENRKLKDFLEEKGKLEEIENHFESCKEVENPIDFVVLFCISYSYFIRSKITHAEIFDNSFSLELTKEEQQIEMLTGNLQRLVKIIYTHPEILRKTRGS